MKNKVVLVGYMGVGKSKVAEKLAKTLQIEWIDLDNLIIKNEQLSIQDIFTTKGEIYFRKQEHQIFKDLLTNQQKSFVLSTGGGTPCYAQNHLFLQSANITSIYLKASIENLIRRISSSKSDRPLLANLNEDEMNDFVAKHLFERSFFYHQAQFVVNTDDKSIDEIVNQIVGLL